VRDVGPVRCRMTYPALIERVNRIMDQIEALEAHR
jgi:hypothetical protein